MDLSITPPTATGVSTRDGLVVAAERLFAEFGINGVSLRTISKAASCANVVAVQYHFRDKGGLIKAIFERRMPALEAMRGKLLSESGTALEDLSLDRLVYILLYPLTVAIDENGRMTYIRFLLQLSQQPEYWNQTNHPIPNIYHFREPRMEDGPTATAIVLLARKLAPIPVEMVLSRVSHLNQMFIAALIDHENALASGLTPWPLARLVDDLIAMATSALAAPVR